MSTVVLTGVQIDIETQCFYFSLINLSHLNVQKENFDFASSLTTCK